MNCRHCGATDYTAEVEARLEEQARALEMRAAREVSCSMGQSTYSRRLSSEAADIRAALGEIRRQQQDKVDWARRWTLNGVTPWDWMSRAEAAEAKLAEADRADSQEVVAGHEVCLASRVEKELSRHVRGIFRKECRACGFPWPCPTVRILNGEE